MQPAKLSRRLLAILLIAAFILSACSSFVARISGRPQQLRVSSEARELLLFLQKQNLDIKTFKGTGRLTLLNSEKKKPTTRVAWIGAIPGSIRIAMHGATGQPAVSFASDGQWHYLFSHINNRFYKKRAAAELFESYFSIPIESKDVVSILAGRVPVDEYSYAAVEKKGSKYGTVLTLRNRWGNVFKKIYFGEDKQRVSKIEAFDNSGARIYEVQFCKMQTVNGYQVPASLVFSKAESAGFQLVIDRYWADVAVSPSVFVLEQPNE
jgi:outer membrane biogenesis lipoprotein LolB